jgi:hypothetical protein
MTPKETPKWKKFEALVAGIQEQLSPNASVTLNEKMKGQRSDVLREVDITVRKWIGQFEIIVAIDCKDYVRPVDVKGVEEFIGLVEDISANKGAMVAANGFTPAAISRAKNSGIDLYRLVDAEEHDWKSYIAIPIVCDFRSLGIGRFTIKGSNSILQELKSQDPKLVPLYDQHNNEIGTPLTLLWEKWNEGDIPHEQGWYTGLAISNNPIFVHAKDGNYELVKITGNFNVIQKLYFGQLPLTKISGLRDEVSGKLVLPGNTELITDWIDSVEVERHWLQLPSIEVLAIKPVMVLTAFDHYPSTIPDDDPKACAG